MTNPTLLPVIATGTCHTTHSACDCVLARLTQAEAIIQQQQDAITRAIAFGGHPDATDAAYLMINQLKPALTAYTTWKEQQT